MELLGDEAQVEPRFGLFADRVNLDKIGARFALNIPLAHKSFWTHLMVHLGDEAQEEVQFGPFKDSATPNAT